MTKTIKNISECGKLVRKVNEDYQDEATLIYDFILVNELCTEDELSMAVDVGGYNTETLNYVIYRQTGYHDIEQLYDTTDERKSLYFSDAVLDYYGLNDTDDEDED